MQFTIKHMLYTVLTIHAGIGAAQAAFAVTCFLGLSDIHECSGGLQMAPFPLDKQTAGYNSPHDWLMSLAVDLAALCVMWS